MKQNDIRFFVLTVEYDLYSPEQTFFLGLSAEIGEFQAKLQKQKSILSRIERARRGWPASLNFPYGRRFNRETKQWSVIEAEAEKIRYAAREYIKGESLFKIAKKVGMSLSNLRETIRDRGGDTWIQRFRVPDLGIDESVPTKIPRILDEETIKAVKKRARANQTYHHGHRKYRYLLSRMIFCDVCGFSLFGKTMGPKRYRFYAHNKLKDRVNPPPKCPSFSSMAADGIEEAVLTQIFRLFGDKAAIEAAAKAAIPNLQEIRQFKQRLKTIRKELRLIESGKEKIIDHIMEGTISKPDVKKRMTALNEQKELLEQERAHINEELASLPSKAQINEEAKIALGLHKQYLKSLQHFFSMTYKEKRTLLESVFSGTDPQGKRYGVYIKKKNGVYFYTIHGHFIHEVGRLPMTEELQRAIFGLSDDDMSIEDLKKSSISKKHQLNS